MAAEVQKMQDAIGPKFGLLVVPFGQFTAGLFVGFYYGWKLALVILCFIPVLGASGIFLGKVTW